MAGRSVPTRGCAESSSMVAVSHAALAERQPESYLADGGDIVARHRVHCNSFLISFFL
jgi:hypothetical protein